MKIENERLEKLANFTQNLMVKGTSILGGHTLQKTNDTGVIYGKDVSVGTPVFGEEKASIADIQAEAAEMDTRQAKNTMAILSNTMTEEDYAEFVKNGGNIDDTEIETIVTVVDKIQISLATYCEDYQGYVGDISREALEKIAGNTQLIYGIANALKSHDLPVTEENIIGVLGAVSMAESLEPVAESTALYLIQNQQDPTIENMYIAQHSTGNQMLGDYGQEFFTKDAGNYYTKIGAGRDYSGMDKKMEEIIVNAGLEPNEETLEAAKWMVEHNIPLTEENLKRADRISEVTIPQDIKKLVESIVAAMAEGEKPAKAPLTTDDNYVRRSEEVLEILEKATTEDVKALVAEKEPVTVENLKQEVETPSGAGQNLRDGDVRVVRAYREIEELRLKMTLEASVKMMRNGIQVETTELSDLVERLRALEEDAYRNMMRGQKIEETEENLNLLSAIAIRGEMLPHLPAAVLGDVLTENVVPTLDVLYDRGMALRADYARAEETYEALGTAPRRDLGDSIQKAFQNMDSLFQEMGLEPTEENQRAVRILGYNSMELTEENIQAVKHLDAKVQYLMRNLTPSITLEMVRERVNPLHMPIDEVNDEIARMRQDLNLTRDDEYSKFLWKMEQSNEISPEEREAYVGIYRLLHQVEKSDGAAIGSLFAQGGELTLQNLLTNIRSQKGQNMDVRVDDALGVAETRTAPENSISAQIERGFSENPNHSENSNHSENPDDFDRNIMEETIYQKNLAGQVLNAIEPEKLAEITSERNIWDMDLEELLDAMRQATIDEELESRFRKEEMQRISEFRQVEDRVIAQLEAYDIPMTFRNISAMEGILQGGQLFKQLLNLDMDGDEEAERMFDNALEASGEEESLQGVYEQLEQKAKALTEHYISEENITSLDVRSMRTLYSQFRILGQMSRQEKYFVPLETENGFTGVNLTILHQRGNRGKVQVSMETELFGTVKAEFYVNRERISGYVASDSADGLERLRSGDVSLLSDLSEIQENVQIEYVKEEKLEEFKPEKGEGEKVLTKQLYGVAKSFLKNLKGLV